MDDLAKEIIKFNAENNKIFTGSLKNEEYLNKLKDLGYTEFDGKNIGCLSNKIGIYFYYCLNNKVITEERWDKFKDYIAVNYGYSDREQVKCSPWIKKNYDGRNNLGIIPFYIGSSENISQRIKNHESSYTNKKPYSLNLETYKHCFPNFNYKKKIMFINNDNIYKDPYLMESYKVMNKMLEGTLHETIRPYIGSKRIF